MYFQPSDCRIHVCRTNKISLVTCFGIGKCQARWPLIIVNEGLSALQMWVVCSMSINLTALFLYRALHFIALLFIRVATL